MPQTYEITAPDGRKFRVTGNGTRDEALAQVQAQYSAQQKPSEFVGPIPTGQELANAREMMQPKKLGVVDAARLTMGPIQRMGLGAGEAGLSIGTGMVTTPLNHFWNAGLEANRLPTEDTAEPYLPKTAEGQAILSGVDRAMRMTGIPQLLEKGLDLDNPDPGVRATGNLIGGVLGVLPAVGPVKAARARRSAIPSRAEIKAASGEMYAGARATGEVLPQSGFSGLIQNAEKMLVDEAFDPTQHPRTASALNRLYEEGTRPGVHGFTPEGSEVIRRHLMNAEDAAIGDIKNPAVSASADSRLAAKLLDDFDDFIDQQLSQAGPQYRNARSLWSAQLKSAEIERLFERAQNQAGQYSVSGMDNALRTQFKSLADNPRRFRRFNEQERQAILKVVRGDLPQNWSQRLGKFAVTRGGVSTLPAMAGFSIDPMLGGILAIAGEGARAGSTLLRTSRARAVDELIRSGAIPSMPPSGIRTVTQPGVLPTYGPANALAVDQAANQLRDERARRNALAR